MLSREWHGTKPGVARFNDSKLQKGMTMLGKLAGAFIGNRVAGRQSGTRGALLGLGIAAIARRGLGPLGLALGAGWAAKKLYARRQESKAPTFPADVQPGRID